MFEDVSALFTVSVYVEAMLGLLLLFTWVQNTEIKAVAWWGSAHLLRAASIALFGMYKVLPDVLTIDVANAILLTSFAVTWAGARLFGGHRVNLIFVVEGAIIWLVACRMPEIADWVTLRAVLSAAIIATYNWLAAAEIWRNSRGQLVVSLARKLYVVRARRSVSVAHAAQCDDAASRRYRSAVRQRMAHCFELRSAAVYDRDRLHSDGHGEGVYGLYAQDGRFD